MSGIREVSENCAGCAEGRGVERVVEGVVVGGCEVQGRVREGYEERGGGMIVEQSMGEKSKVEKGSAAKSSAEESRSPDKSRAKKEREEDMEKRAKGDRGIWVVDELLWGVKEGLLGLSEDGGDRDSEGMGGVDDGKGSDGEEVEGGAERGAGDGVGLGGVEDGEDWNGGVLEDIEFGGVEDWIP